MLVVRKIMLKIEKIDKFVEVKHSAKINIAKIRRKYVLITKKDHLI